MLLVMARWISKLKSRHRGCADWGLPSARCTVLARTRGQCDGAISARWRETVEGLVRRRCDPIIGDRPLSGRTIHRCASKGNVGDSDIPGLGT